MVFLGAIVVVPVSLWRHNVRRRLQQWILRNCVSICIEHFVSLLFAATTRGLGVRVYVLLDCIRLQRLRFVIFDFAIFRYVIFIWEMGRMRCLCQYFKILFFELDLFLSFTWLSAWTLTNFFVCYVLPCIKLDSLCSCGSTCLVIFGGCCLGSCVRSPWNSATTSCSR